MTEEMKYALRAVETSLESMESWLRYAKEDFQRLERILLSRTKGDEVSRVRQYSQAISKALGS